MEPACSKRQRFNLALPPGIQIVAAPQLFPEIRHSRALCRMSRKLCEDITLRVDFCLPARPFVQSNGGVDIRGKPW
jgi:hypothetical protein